MAGPYKRIRDVQNEREFQGLDKDGAESPQTRVALPELGLHERPRHKCRAVGREADEALRQPLVDVEMAEEEEDAGMAGIKSRREMRQMQA